MKLRSKCSLIFLVLAVFSCKAAEFREGKDHPDGKQRKNNALNGPSIQVDPDFAYYQNRSNESIAEEIELAGYKSVHYFVTNENFINKGLIKAFQERNIAVWAMVLGNGTYTTRSFPKGWEDWKLKFIGPYDFGSFTFFSPFSKGYLDWKKASIKRLLLENPFDGIEFAESYLPGSWEKSAFASHGDVSVHAQLAFKELHHRNIPEFYEVTSPDYYKSNPELYRLWMDFRVDGVNHFLNEIVNAKDGIRAVRPDVLVGTWSLAINAGPHSMVMLREHNGLDVKKMITLVKPDIHFIQTHYPDWIKSEAELPAGYMKDYQSFFEEVRAVNRQLPIGLQADIGSDKRMIKSGKWCRDFFNEAKKKGYQTATAYEYSIGGYIYHDLPVLLKAVKVNATTIVLSFSKRIAETKAAADANFQFLKAGNVVGVKITGIVVDGNRIQLTTEKLPEGKFQVAVNKVEDTPSLWLFKNYAANTAVNQRITIN